MSRTGEFSIIAPPSPYRDRSFRVLWSTIKWLPPRMGTPVRRRALRRFGATIDPTVTIGPGVTVLCPAGLVIGPKSGIARDVVIDARAGVRVGADTMIGFESVLLSATHPKDQLHARGEHPLEGAEIVIGDSAWIGARCMVLPGVQIGHRTTIGAMSLVNTSVADDTVAAGIPVRALRSGQDPGRDRTGGHPV